MVLFALCAGFLSSLTDASRLGADEPSELTAIDIVLEPDAMMRGHARAAYSRLVGMSFRRSPKGPYDIRDKSDPLYFSCLQRYVKTADLEKVYEAVGKVLAEEKPAGWKLKAYKYDYVVWDNAAVTVILIEPTDDLINYQKKLIDAVAPFTVKTGTAAAFVTTKEDPRIHKLTIDNVSTYVPAGSGKNFRPHVTVAVAPPDDVKKMLDKFQPFTFSPVGVSVYHLGNFGAPRTKLRSWELKP
jgi:hypothetical protein